MIWRRKFSGWIRRVTLYPPVITGTPGDHRLARVATISPLDKRISYGCVNVPIKFFNDVVLKTFTGTNGIVYILPEVKTIKEVFPAFYIVDTRPGE